MLLVNSDYTITLLKIYVSYISYNNHWGEPYSEPHHVRSTVKSVFLLTSLYVCLFVCLSLPYMVECIKSHSSVVSAILSLNHKLSQLLQRFKPHNNISTVCTNKRWESIMQKLTKCSMTTLATVIIGTSSGDRTVTMFSGINEDVVRVLKELL